MGEREPQLWVGDSHTLDRPTGDELREIFGTPGAKDDEPSSLTTDAL